MIKVVIAILGVDQHDIGAVIISRILRDAGMEVVYLGKFLTPLAVANAGVQEDADVIGLSCHSWEYRHMIPELLALLKEKNARIPLVIGGSIITAGDKKELSALGVAAAFNSSTPPETLIKEIVRLAGK